MKYLAIDIGSSYVKAGLLDLDNGIIADQRKVAQAPRMDDSGRRHEVDAEQMFGIVEGLLQDYLSQYGRAIRGILMSTQMHGFVLADRQARPVTPYVSWQDERSLETMPGTEVTWLDHMTGFISREDMADTGVYLKPPLALCNLHVLLQTAPDVAEGTCFCTIGSYIIFRLTGVNACHITNAGPTGFADVRSGSWSEMLIRLAGAERLTFPKLISGFEACGTYRSGGHEIPVYPDIGDQQAGALGSLAIPVTDAIVNIGTGAQLGLIRSDFVPGPYEIRPFFDGNYLYTITRLPGGRNLDVLIRFFADIVQRVTRQPVSDQTIWEAVQASLATVDSRGLTADCSFFKSEYSDHGRIDGIYFDNLTLGTVMSAAFEDIARTYRAALDRLGGSAAAAGIADGSCAGRVDRLVFSGGVANRLPLLRQAIMRQLGISRSIDPIDNEVFVGLYRLALHLENGGGDSGSNRARGILATRNDICQEAGSQLTLLIHPSSEAV